MRIAANFSEATANISAKRVAARRCELDFHSFPDRSSDAGSVQKLPRRSIRNRRPALDSNWRFSAGQLTLSGERKRETEEKGDNFYRSEREYGTFCRTIPLPDGVNLQEMKASFADGVLEVSVPLPGVRSCGRRGARQAAGPLRAPPA